MLDTADRQLRVRMLVALGLIVVLPFVFVYAFVHLANALATVFLESSSGGPREPFAVDPLVVAVLVLGGLAVQYWLGPRIVRRSVGARTVSSDDYPDVHAALTRVAAQADAAKPRLAVARTDVPNAFAVAGGRPVFAGDEDVDDPGGTVVVTTGLLERLEDDELEAVLAHELAHLRNKDANLMTVAWLLPTLTYYLAVAAYYVLYGMFRLFVSGSSSRSSGTLSFGSRSGRSNNDGKGVIVAIVAIVVSAVATIAISAMFWLASVLLYRVLSRYREYVADRAAATITGSPGAFAGALEKLDESMSEQPDRDLRKLDGGAEALYLAPLEDRAFGSTEKELISTDIFPDTHPPTSERIARLRELAADSPARTAASTAD